MSRLISMIILLMAATEIFSQIDFKSDETKNIEHPEFIRQIDTIFKSYDFQLRFWMDGSTVKTKAKFFYTMTFNDGYWHCDLFKFVEKQKQSYLEKVYLKVDNCDSIWNCFVKNNILNLPSYNALKEKIDSCCKNKSFVVACESSYTFEFLSRDKYKKLQYGCPNSYSKEYPQIEGYKNISDIIRLIYKVIGNNLEPS